MSGVGRITAYPPMLSAPKRGNSIVRVMWGKAGEGRFIKSCDALNCSFLILTFPLSYNTHFLSCWGWEQHKQMCKDRKLQGVLGERE